jgi:hypothetical protein
MKTKLLLLLATALVITSAALLPFLATAAESGTGPEYATLRWAGRDNTHLIRPNGMVEILGPKFAGAKKPDKVDDRSFFMNLAMNALAREGYELVAMTPDDYVFKRAANR